MPGIAFLNADKLAAHTTSHDEMDYSQDNDGSSPWNTSPKASAHLPEPTTPTMGNSMYSSTAGSFPSPALSQGFRDDDDQEGERSQDPLGQSQGSQDMAASARSAVPQDAQPTATEGQQPRQETQLQSDAATGSPAGRKTTQPGVQRKLQCKITALERTGKSDVILRFDAQTNLPKFRSTQFRDIRRTHAEFLKLADHLISSNPEAFVPAVPLAVTSAGAGTDEDEWRVKGSMQRWLNTVCSNDVLARDEEMIFFIESDFGYSPVMRMKQPATGVRRKVIKQFAPPPDDTPELQDARPTVKLFYLGAMDSGQKVNKVVKTRKALGLAESDLGVRLAQMSVQETHSGLGTAYRKLGRTIQTTGDLHAAQGTAEATTLGDALEYHSNDAFIVKETLTNRHILLRDLLSSQSATRSRLSAADRLKSSSSVRRDKVDEAIAQLDEAKSHEQYLTQKTQRVTANLLTEKRRWFARTAADVRASVREYVLREIEAERRTLANLESVRPDIRAIDASGGLSRLGRETHPAARRASLASSQGPRGDSWSGVQRRGDALSRSAIGGFAGPTVPEEGEDDSAGASQAAGAGDGARASRPGTRGSTSSKTPLEDDDDRVDARNAASRLAASTF